MGFFVGAREGLLVASVGERVGALEEPICVGPILGPRVLLVGL